MAVPIPISKLGVGSGGSKAWKISFDAKQSKITVGFGTMFYNGKYFTTKDLLSGGTTADGKAIGEFSDNQIFGQTGPYVYLVIYNPLSSPTETSSDLKIKIDILSDTVAPKDKNKNAPLTEFIPLAHISSTNKVTDLRPAFYVNNFPFLAPGQDTTS